MSNSNEPPRDTGDARQRGEAALKQAERAAHRGDMKAAKHWTDVAQSMVAAARRIEDIPTPPLDYEEEERIRAELRQRVATFCTYSGDVERWRWQKELWDEVAAFCARENLAVPLPPMPEKPAEPDSIAALPPDIRARFYTD